MLSVARRGMLFSSSNLNTDEYIVTVAPHSAALRRMKRNNYQLLGSREKAVLNWV